MCRNILPSSYQFHQIFKLDVLYECFDGTLAVAPSSHVVEQLHSIIKMTSDLSTCPVGILTSERRDTWTECRERLLIGILVKVLCQLTSRHHDYHAVYFLNLPRIIDFRIGLILQLYMSIFSINTTDL